MIPWLVYKESIVKLKVISIKADVVNMFLVHFHCLLRSFLRNYAHHVSRRYYVAISPVLKHVMNSANNFTNWCLKKIRQFTTATLS